MTPLLTAGSFYYLRVPNALPEGVTLMLCTPFDFMSLAWQVLV